MTSRDEAEKAVFTLLKYLETDPNREGLKKTPRRVIDSWDEIFSGYKTDSKSILQATFNAEGYDGKIVYDFFINSNMKPIVIFEFIHIENKLFKKLLELMVNKKYYFFRVEENLICYPQGREFII